MITPHQDLITLPKMLAKAPSMIKKIPKLYRGVRLIMDNRTDVHTGLGFTFAKAVKANPNATAIKFEDMQLTYKQFDEWSNQLANYLLNKGLKKGDVFSVALENRPELLCACMAAAKTGTIAALINTSQTGKVLIHSINLVKPKLVIVGAEMTEAFQQIKEDIAVSDNSYLWWEDSDTYNNQQDTDQVPQGMNSLGPLIHEQSKVIPATSKDAYAKDSLLYIFTSGTTGLPKAVVFNHSRWMKAYGVFGHTLNLTNKDTIYVPLPLYHGTGIIVCWSSAIAGSSAIALRRKFSATNFWQDIHKFNATSFGYVGELCRYLLDTPPDQFEKNNPVTKMIGNGLRTSIWKEFKDRFGIEEVLEVYAASEGNIGFSNIFNFDNTVGFCPLPYKLVAYDQEADEPVRDKDGFMQEVKVGEVGLLLGEITPKAPFEGYTDPEKTKSKIFDDVLVKGDSYFNTGDLMRGIGFRHCQFVDRVGDTFRWRGENVSTTEVENIIAECEGVGEAIVYGVEIKGTNGRAGMAAITLHDGINFDDAYQKALLAQLTRHLPTYAVPVFIRLQDCLETTGTFKYSKNKLKEVGFDSSKTDDKLWVRLPNDELFTLIDDAEYHKIQGNQYRF